MHDKASVLVLADHSLLGALLGLWIETAGARPVYPEASQSAETALAELDPAVIVLDVEHPATGSCSLHEAATSAQIPVVLVGPARLRERLLQASAQRGARAFMIPEERTLLFGVLATMANGRPAEI
jgi:DNA-binding NtrC family response regulator